MLNAETMADSWMFLRSIHDQFSRFYPCDRFDNGRVSTKFNELRSQEETIKAAALEIVT
jgi:hypothetical protein